jgi:hypothetical protein
MLLTVVVVRKVKGTADGYAWMILSSEVPAQYNQMGLISKGWRVKHFLPADGMVRL